MLVNYPLQLLFAGQITLALCNHLTGNSVASQRLFRLSDTIKCLCAIIHSGDPLFALILMQFTPAVKVAKPDLYGIKGFRIKTKLDISARETCMA